MTQDKSFSISSLFWETLSNGFRDDVNENPEILGFILGAIQKGFSVKKPGSIEAKYGKISIYCFMDAKTVKIFHGKNKIKEMTYGKDGFLWVDCSIIKGNFYINHDFICKTI